MRLILDTHTVIWFITNNPKLPTKTNELIKNAANACLVSSASLWKMAIKVSLGKLDLKTDLKNIFNIIAQSNFDVLPIMPDHILSVEQLSFHHRDPFDRMIIAQAMVKQMKIITKDDQFSNYGVSTLWDV